MASFLDIKSRVDKIGAHACYRGSIGLPVWLTIALTAAAGRPLVVNVKGRKPDDVLVVVRLVDFERLVGDR